MQAGTDVLGTHDILVLNKRWQRQKAVRNQTVVRISQEIEFGFLCFLKFIFIFGPCLMQHAEG